MSLYRKHRPQKFTDIVGQQHIKKVLTNSIEQDKIGHAYLFSGPRGTGKTTMARLLAKALNCRNRVESREVRGESRVQRVVNDKENIDNKPFEKPLKPYPLNLTPNNYEPCNECISCVEITADRSMDVIEIDAASNRGIDEIRELRDKVRYAPSSSAYKVYIIDEVHMLTKEAFNALLKTLEEPPAHCVFIMATTELHKVPDTILSRTQQFDFKRANQKELITNLMAIISKEKLNITPDAVELIARAGDGSFRDSVSILDQIASLNEKEIQLDHVKEILGLVPQNLLEDFIKFLENDDAKRAIELINQIYEQGYDLAQFNQTVIEALRDKMVKNNDYNLLKVIKKFIEAGQEMKYAQIPQIPMELAVVEISNQLPVTSNQLTKELNNTETKEQTQKPTIKSEENLEKDILTANSEKPTTNLEVDNPVAKSQKPIASSQSLIAKWPEVVGVVLANNQSLGTLLKDASALEIKDDKLILAVKFKFYAERIMASDKITTVLDAVEKVLGEKLGVECVVSDSEQRAESREVRGENREQRDESREIISTLKPQVSTLVDDALEVFGE